MVPERELLDKLISEIRDLKQDVNMIKWMFFGLLSAIAVLLINLFVMR
jgi:hypothetical protein